MASEKPSIAHSGSIIRRFLVLVVASVILASMFSTGCTSSEPETLTTTNTTTTAEPEEEQVHTRIEIDFYQGINEPRSADWDYIIIDSNRLQQNGFNTVTLEPPVLINERAGGKPRVILEGAAIVTPGLIDNIHEKGFAIFLSPTTAGPGFEESVTLDDVMLERLTEDTLEWAATAEADQVELFTPLSRCNLVLGTDSCRAWLQQVLPAVKQRYSGPVAAKVVADIEQTPIPGGIHDFELLDYRGYDFLMVGIHPWGHIYNEERFRSYVIDVLDRAEAVAMRDGLQGVIISDLRLPRNTDEEVKLETGTWINEQQQAEITDMVMALSLPRVSGFFYYGWSLAGYGARGFPVEDVLIKYYGGQADNSDEAGTTSSTEQNTVIDNG
jgi:hypothetical protein